MDDVVFSFRAMGGGASLFLLIVFVFCFCFLFFDVVHVAAAAGGVEFTL